MPKRSRKGVVRSPVLVVAPTRVNFARSNSDRPRRRPLPDDKVKLKILHRRIKDFFHGRIQPMDFINEKDVALLKVSEKRREVARLRDHRPRRQLEIYAKLARNDLCEGRFPQTGRPANRT